MALQLNPFSDSALAALAGQRIPYLNLPLADKSALGSYYSGLTDSLFKQQNVNAELSGQQNQYNINSMLNQGQNQRTAMTNAADLQRQNLANQGSMNVTNANNQNSMGIAQMNNATNLQQIGNTAAYQQGMLGIDNKNANVNQQNANTSLLQANNTNNIQQQQVAVEQGRLSMQQRAQQNEDQINTRGAAAQLIQSTMNTPEFQNLAKTDPTSANNYLNQQITAIHTMHPDMMSDTEYQQLLNSDVPTKQLALHYDMQVSNGAIMLKHGVAGNLGMINPGMTGTVALDKDTTTKTQQALQTGMDASQKIQNLIDTNNPGFYNVGVGKTVLGNIENRVTDALGQPQTDSGKLSDARNSFFANVQAAGGPLLQDIQAAKLSNRTAAIAGNLLPNGSESSVNEANDKLKAVQQQIDYLNNVKQQQLVGGLPINEAAFQKQMVNAQNAITAKYAKTNIPSTSDTSTNPSASSASSNQVAVPKDPRQWDDNMWNAVAAHNNVSVGKLKADILGNQ